MHTIRDVTAVAQNPEVLANYYRNTSQRLPTVVMYTVNLEWLQSNTRKPWWLQYLKVVFREMPIVTTWLVFQNQVTYYMYMKCTYIMFKYAYVDVYICMYVSCSV